MFFVEFCSIYMLRVSLTVMKALAVFPFVKVEYDVLIATYGSCKMNCFYVICSVCLLL